MAITPRRPARSLLALLGEMCVAASVRFLHGQCTCHDLKPQSVLNVCMYACVCRTYCYSSPLAPAAPLSLSVPIAHTCACCLLACLMCAAFHLLYIFISPTPHHGMAWACQGARFDMCAVSSGALSQVCTYMHNIKEKHCAGRGHPPFACEPSLCEPLFALLCYACVSGCETKCISTLPTYRVIISDTSLTTHTCACVSYFRAPCRACRP